AHDAGVGLRAAVAAHVDAGPQPPGTAQLAAHDDALARLVVAAQRALGPRRPPGDRGGGAQLGLEVVERLVERAERALLGLAAPADDHAEGVRHAGAQPTRTTRRRAGRSSRRRRARASTRAGRRSSRTAGARRRWSAASTR